VSSGHGSDDRCDIAPGRVAIFLTDLTGGGAERAMVNLAAGMADRGHQVDLVLASATGPYLRNVDDRVEVVDLAAGRTVWAVLPLVRYLRRTRPDVLLSTLHHACIAATVAHVLARTPTRLFLREANMVSERPVSAFDVRRRGLRRTMRWAYARADGAIAVSEGVADDLRQVFGVADDTLWTLYNPVVSDDVEALAAHAPDHAWLTGDGPPVVLGVGRLVEQKDFTTLIDAFARVRKRRDARLIVLGEGPQREVLERRARERGVADDVSLPGFVDNPFAYLARGSVYVLSSRYEGLPGTLIQAMACGCPVVATDCRSGPAEVLDRGRYGELVPVGDAAAMAAAIDRALDAPTSADALRSRAAVFATGPVVSAYMRAFAGERVAPPGDASSACTPGVDAR
jgi:glycosyltransferase involved in cell wall biosynthesis